MKSKKTTGRESNNKLDHPNNGNKMTKHDDNGLLPFHPSANIFPIMNESERQKLEIDIAKNGLINPITLHSDGSVLDGRNRLLACKQTDVEPHFVQWEGNGSPIDFVISQNLERRHLSMGQKAIVAEKIANYSHGGDRIKGKNYPLISREQAGKMVRVSKKSVDFAAKVVKDGVPELVNMVEQNDISISAAAVLAELPGEQQSNVLSEGTEMIMTHVNKIKSDKKAANRKKKQKKLISPMRWTFKDAKKELTSGSVDLIILDTNQTPPNETVVQVSALLKPEGILACIVHRDKLADGIRIFSKVRPYRNIAILLDEGNAKKDQDGSVALFFTDKLINCPLILNATKADDAEYSIIEFVGKSASAVWVPPFASNGRTPNNSKGQHDTHRSEKSGDINGDLATVDI